MCSLWWPLSVIKSPKKSKLPTTNYLYLESSLCTTRYTVTLVKSREQTSQSFASLGPSLVPIPLCHFCPIYPRAWGWGYLGLACCLHHWWWCVSLAHTQIVHLLIVLPCFLRTQPTLLFCLSTQSCSLADCYCLLLACMLLMQNTGRC